MASDIFWGRAGCFFRISSGMAISSRESQHDIEELREIEHAVAKCIEENGKADDVPERDAHEPGYPHLANREAADLRKHPSEFFVAELDLVFDIHGAPAF